MRHRLARSVAAARLGGGELWLLVVFMASFPVLFAAAWLGQPTAFAATLVVSHLTEWIGRRRTPRIFRALDNAQLAEFPRQLARDAALAVFAWRAQPYSAADVDLLIGGLLTIYLLSGLYLVLQRYLGRLRAMPAVTRNLDVSALGIPPEPRPKVLLTGGHVAVQTLPVAAGVLADEMLGGSTLGLIGVAVAVTVAVAAVVAVGIAALRAGHLADRAPVFKAVHKKIKEYAPEVLLYHSGPAGTEYQVNSWLPVLESLGRPCMVLLRKAIHLPGIADTSMPIVCVPAGSDVMNLHLPSLRLALYVGNVGDNLHMIRHPEVKHVFVGHGDSDKLASANRVSRIYDEVWVAGPAARERYHNAGVGIRDEAIIEVGRPQLEPVRRGAAQPGTPFTVLYAPTWEGWTNDMFLTSVLTMGERLVRQLTTVDGVRVVYKPHPLTGLRNAAVRRAHRRIVRTLRDANGGRSASFAGWPAQGAAHLVVSGSEPDLYSCFNHADMLIGDVSSVVSDFTPSDKPYVVTIPQGADAEVFRAENSAARGAYLLGPDMAELTTIMDAVRGPRPDPLADHRRAAREYLLGPDNPDAMARFRAAVDALVGPPQASAKGRSGLARPVEMSTVTARREPARAVRDFNGETTS